ncbi:BON domain-containing protein [Terriglobus sp. TAA 43]|uniref:BON domain-containing protein n=1 Tax=Terriglobus sp. TAA 43 TaxID=278961 RepID=UPI000647FE28|nr:BON domain-containing protein [Terriglobus sp. TAA 43]
MRWNIAARTLGSLAFAAVLSAPVAGFAQAQPASTGTQNAKLSDAQVEANVLKAFAEDNRLANQSINSSTVFGTVTLTGSVTDEASRTAAEQVASHVGGVTKVVSQLTVGAPETAAADPADANMMPADGSSLPAAQGAIIAAQHPQTDPENGNQAPPQQGYAQPQDGQQASSQMPDGDPNGYPQNAPQQAPQRRLYYRDYQRQMAQQQQGGYPPQQQQGYAQQQGQPGGVQVTVPDGTVLPVRINHWISSGNAQPGSTFDAFVTSDILAGGEIAIPRGATVEGTVVDAKGAGVLKGRGELTLQLTALNLGGQRIPLQSQPFVINGHDKSLQSVNSTIIGAGLGALFGAAVGGGTGAAIGAGVGGAAGLGTSAASGGGNANVPAEAMLQFRLVAPVQVVTVSEAEMQRLGGYAGPAGAYRQGPGPYARPYPAVGVGVYGYPGYPYGYYRRGYYGPRPYWY